MLLFNLEIWNGFLYSTEQFTDVRIAPTLAQAEKFVVHVRAAQISNAAAKVNVNFYVSNDGETYVLQKADQTSSLGSTSAIVNQIVNESGVLMGAFVRIGVSMTAADSANVRIIVAGRGEETLG